MAESRDTRQQPARPKASWLPLPKAVFRFGIAGDSEKASNSPLGGDATALPLPELHAILKEKSGAYRVDINPVRCTFGFQFLDTRSAYGGPPWAILEEINWSKSMPDPRADAEALFNKEGFVRRSDEEAAKMTEELKAIRVATGLVWRQFMVRAFDRAIAANEVTLIARIGSPMARFEELPADLWPLLSILDWQTAIARDPEGTLLYSVHVRHQKVTISTVRDETAAIRGLAAELENDPELKRGDAKAWCRKAGFNITERGFQSRIWPRARARAGLTETGHPGRKSKSSR